MAITTYALPSATNWDFADNVIGVPDLGTTYVAGNLGAPGIAGLPVVTTEAQLGAFVGGQSYDTTYGGNAKFILLAIPTSTATTQGLFYKYDGGYNIAVVATSVASSAQSGLPSALCINSTTSNATSIQYAWFQVQGRGAALKSVSITAQPSVPLFVSGATAGRVRTTSSAFRAYIGMRSANIATATGSILPVMLSFPAIGPGV